MRWRFLILITVAVSFAMVASAASATRQGQSDIPACEEILTVQEAQAAMGERVAFILNREVRDDTRVCAYAGGTRASIGHGVGVNWGPYADVRKRAGGLAKKFICKQSKLACRRMDEAMSLRRDRASFAALEDALDHVGITRQLSARAFDGSPAFVWKPSNALASSELEEAGWVFVYDAKSAHMLQVLCTDIDARAPDVPCAIAAAKRAYMNVTS
jgi:hypothetical protein